jgi:hypothetical protein
MKRSNLAILSLLAVASASAAADGSPLAALRMQDERLLRIVEPIMADNVQLCDRTMPDLGVSLQSTDQYAASGQPGFAAPVAFAAVLPGSAAAQAGIERDDGLLSIDGNLITRRPALKNSPLRDSAFAALTEHDPAKPLELGIVHNGVRRNVTVTVRPECLALVEVLDENKDLARSDGHTIQIAYGLATRASDDQVAVIFAHELAHSIMRHRERLSASGTSKGLLGQFGRSKRLGLQAEEEADRLSVYLLANAGIDPHAAPALWRSKLGRHISGGIFRDAAHPSAKTRAAILEAEIAQHIRPGQPSYPAALLAKRTQPMK